MSSTYRPTRRTSLGGAGPVAATMAGWSTTAAASRIAGGSAFGPPNIVLIMLDDVGYGDWSCYGSRRIETPHIDAVASAGLTFPQMYSAAIDVDPGEEYDLARRRPRKVRELTELGTSFDDAIPPQRPEALRSRQGCPLTAPAARDATMLRAGTRHTGRVRTRRRHVSG